MLIGFWALPTYLNAFGKEYYGMFLLAFEFPLILGVFDLGASKSILRFTSQYGQDKDARKFQAAISVNITLAAFTSLFIALCILFIGIASSSIYHLNGTQYKIALGLFTVSAISSFFIFLDLIPMNILNGFNIFHERNKAQLLSVFYSLGLLLCVKFIGISLFTFSVFFALGYFLIFVIDVFLLHRKKLLAGIFIKLVGVKQIIKSGFLRYNMELFGLSVIAVFSSQADKQIVGILVGIESVTLYVVITKAYYVCKSLLGNFYNVLRPTLAVAKSFSPKYIQKLFIMTTQGISVILSLLSLYLFFLWPVLSRTWMHSNDYINYSAFVALSIINLSIASLAGMFISYFTLTDEAMIVVRTDFLTVLINVIVSIVCCILYGAIGAIIGTTVQVIINAVWYIILSHKKKLIDLRSYFSSSFVAVILVFILDYIAILEFNLPIFLRIIICIFTTSLVLFHLYRLNLFNVLKAKKLQVA